MRRGVHPPATGSHPGIGRGDELSGLVEERLGVGDHLRGLVGGEHRARGIVRIFAVALHS